MTRPSFNKTALRIVSDQAEEIPESVHQSLEAAIGIIQIQYLDLCLELTRKSGDQSAERLLQCLVAISSTALAAVSVHIIPELERGES